MVLPVGIGAGEKREISASDPEKIACLEEQFSRRSRLFSRIEMDAGSLRHFVSP
jgi:hypothetical protein